MRVVVGIGVCVFSWRVHAMGRRSRGGVWSGELSAACCRGVDRACSCSVPHAPLPPQQQPFATPSERKRSFRPRSSTSKGGGGRRNIVFFTAGGGFCCTRGEGGEGGLRFPKRLEAIFFPGDFSLFRLLFSPPPLSRTTDRVPSTTTSAF